MRHMKPLLVALVALAALALPAGTAVAWDPDGQYTLEGSLTSELELGQSPNPLLVCDTEFTADLDSGTTNPGEVLDSEINGCISVSGCSVTVDGVDDEITQETPWDVSGTNTGGGSGTVTVSEVYFTATYTGAQCPVSQGGTCSFTAEGDVEGDYDGGSGEVTFADDPGLEVTSSNCLLVPSNTDVSLSGLVEVQGAAPELE
jgi:hypothetical protein